MCSATFWIMTTFSTFWFFILTSKVDTHEFYGLVIVDCSCCDSFLWSHDISLKPCLHVQAHYKHYKYYIILYYYIYIRNIRVWYPALILIFIVLLLISAVLLVEMQQMICLFLIRWKRQEKMSALWIRAWVV